MDEQTPNDRPLDPTAGMTPEDAEAYRADMVAQTRAAYQRAIDALTQAVREIDWVEAIGDPNEDLMNALRAARAARGLVRVALADEIGRLG